MDRPKPFLVFSAYALYVHFALQLVAGGLLATAYCPDRAHAATAALHHGAWAVVQGFHYWGSAVMIVHAMGHLVAVTWAGWWKGPQARAYLVALVLAGVSLAFQFTGNVLPADRHGVQTATVEGSIASRIPAVGPSLARLAMGGDVASPRTVALWYDLHRYALPVVLVAALLLGMAAPRIKTAKWPLAIPALVALGLALIVSSPLGTAAGPDDYGLYDAKPSWYTVSMHGLLVWGGWKGAVLVPAVFGLLLASLPLWKPKPGVARAILVAFGGLGIAASLLSGGAFAPLVGTRDPLGVAIGPAIAQKEPQDVKLAARGRTLYGEQGCAGCHGKDGLQALNGPSLANVWKRHPEADYYTRYIHEPQSVKKGSTMPAYPNLKPEELRALAEFLRFAR